MIPRIEVTGLGNYVRNQGYVTGAIEFSYETHMRSERRCAAGGMRRLRRLGERKLAPTH